MKPTNIFIPPVIEVLLQTLTSSGFDSFVVGGCIRDSLLGLPVQDWDITTNASPQEVMDCFPCMRIIDYGLKHNTTTLLTKLGPVEITTYRSGRPDTTGKQESDSQCENPLYRDLEHRDFTVNALAYHPQQGLMDFFGGFTDLQRKTLRCVENAEARLSEDPVRIMRALRFAVTKNFIIEPDTHRALLRQCDLLRNTAQERITSELMTFFTGSGLKTYLLDYRDIFSVILPEITASFDFDQKNPAHCFDVWHHTAASIDLVTAEVSWPLNDKDIPLLRLALLFHDLGKPSCFSVDEEGIGHCYGHPKVSTSIVTPALKRLKLDNKTIEAVTDLVCYHDTTINAVSKDVLKWLHILGTERFYQLLHVKKADILAHAPVFHSRLSLLDHLHKLVGTIQTQGQCFNIRDLCINGHDLIAAGISPGPLIGRLLENLLMKVMNGTCPNSREALITEAFGEIKKDSEKSLIE